MVTYTEIRGGSRCRYVSSLDIRKVFGLPGAELGGSLILEFDVLVVKVPLPSRHIIGFYFSQVKRRPGETLQYKIMANQILQELRL